MPRQAWLVQLSPRAPMRVGTHPEDIDRARPFASSDTLFGALCWAMRQLFGEAALESWLERFRAETPPLRLSSLLPMVRVNGQVEPLLPMPQRRPAGALPDRKWLKQARFVDFAAYRWLLSGSGDAPALMSDALIGGPLRDTLPGSGEEPQRIWEIQSRPRVTVDRVSGASALYESAAAHFANGAGGVTVRPGLYLVADEGELARVLTCLEFLGEAGIGGERSTGLGRFAIESPRRSPLPVSESPAAGPTLSLCWPTPGDLARGALELPEHLGYRVVERSGWIASPEWAGWRSRRVAMLAEGSYLGGAGPGGALVDCTPEPGRAHAVYRYGFGIFLEEAQL